MQTFSQKKKDTVLSYANKHSVSNTSKKFGIAVSTIYAWIRRAKPVKSLQVSAKKTTKVTKKAKKK